MQIWSCIKIIPTFLQSQSDEISTCQEISQVDDFNSLPFPASVATIPCDACNLCRLEN